jgi:hypothetical protein
MKKHVKNFNGFRTKQEVVNETVYQVENTYRVNVIVDVEAKLLSSYSKKVKQNTGKEIQDLMGNAMLAEELVKYIIKENLDADKIPATAIIGGAQGQAQGQGQAQAQDIQAQPQAQTQDAQVQTQTQVQPQSQDGQSQVQVSSAGQGGENLPI